MNEYFMMKEKIYALGGKVEMMVNKQAHPNLRMGGNI